MDDPDHVTIEIFDEATGKTMRYTLTRSDVDEVIEGMMRGGHPKKILPVRDGVQLAVRPA